MDAADPTPVDRAGEPDEPLSAVMVCGHGGCAGACDASLEALRPLVARSPRAVLIRSACLQGGTGACRPAAGTAAVRLQRCTPQLRAVGRPVSLCERAAPTYRRVESWLDGR